MSSEKTTDTPARLKLQQNDSCEFLPIDCEVDHEGKSPCKSHKIRHEKAAHQSASDAPSGALKTEEQYVDGEHSSASSSSDPDFVDALNNTEELLGFAHIGPKINNSKKEAGHAGGGEDSSLSYKDQVRHYQGELASMTQNFEASSKSVQNLQEVLNDYEEVIQKMIIETRELKNSKYNEDVQTLNKALPAELSAMEAAYKELKIKYDDMKIVTDGIRKNEELQRKTISCLEGDTVRAEEKYGALKRHAEEKLEEANMEIARVRNAYEKEISALKARLTKTELTCKPLETSVEAKSRENKELMAICDELIQKMDRAS